MARLKNRQYTEAALRHFNLEDGDALDEVSPELLPVVALDRLDLLGAGGAHPWAISLVQAAGVGVFSHVGIRNPTGSGLICLVDAIAILHAAGIGYRVNVRLQAATLTAGSGTFFRDLRFTARRSPILQLSGTDAAQLGSGPILRVQWNVQATQTYNVGFVLSPGSDLLLTTEVNNNAVDASFWGWARHAQPGELDFARA